MESHALARAHAYGMLAAPGGDGVYALSQDYIDAAIRDVALQLSRAGIRLAVLLNRVLTTGVNKSCGRC